MTETKNLNNSLPQNLSLSTLSSPASSSSPSTPSTPTRRQTISKNQQLRQFKDLYNQWEKQHKNGLEIIISELNPKIIDFDSIKNDETRKSIRFTQIYENIEELKAVYDDLMKIVESMSLINKNLDCSDSGYVVDSLRDELNNKLLVCKGIFNFSEGSDDLGTEIITASDNLTFFASCWKHQPSLNVAQLKFSLKALEEKIIKV